MVLKMFASMDKVRPKIIKSDTKPVSDLSPLTNILRDSLLQIESSLDTSRLEDLTPKLKRPHFDGGDLLAYNKFFEFKCAFDNWTRDAKDDSVRLELLKDTTSGTALGLIQDLDITVANYKKAWEILSYNYGNSEENRAQIIDKVFNTSFV